MEKTTNLLKLSLYNLSNIKLITIDINQGNEYGQQSCPLTRSTFHFVLCQLVVPHGPPTLLKILINCDFLKKY